MKTVAYIAGGYVLLYALIAAAVFIGRRRATRNRRPAAVAEAPRIVTAHAGSDYAKALLGMHGPEAQTEARRNALDFNLWENEMKDVNQ